MPRVGAQMRKWEQATNAYLQNLSATGVSQTTLSNRATRLEVFTRFMWEHDEFRYSGPTFLAVQGWRNDLVSTGKKGSTVRQYMVELSAFFNWACDPAINLYEKNPVSKTLMPTVKDSTRPLDVFLTDRQAALLWSIDRPKSCRTDTWARDYAVVVLILSAGLRNGEILDLRLCDVDMDSCEITVEHGKGDKFRVVDMPAIAKTAIQLYLNSGIRPSGLSDGDYLFGTRADSTGHRREDIAWKRGSRDWLSKQVERHVFCVTGVHGITSHDLRHVCARLDLNNGAGISELQLKMGHATPVTTQLYSGRLAARGKRQTAAAAFQERDRQAAINEVLLRRQMA